MKSIQISTWTKLFAIFFGPNRFTWSFWIWFAVANIFTSTFLHFFRYIFSQTTGNSFSDFNFPPKINCAMLFEQFVDVIYSTFWLDHFIGIFASEDWNGCSPHSLFSFSVRVVSRIAVIFMKNWCVAFIITGCFVLQRIVHPWVIDSNWSISFVIWSKNSQFLEENREHDNNIHCH